MAIRNRASTCRPNPPPGAAKSLLISAGSGARILANNRVEPRITHGISHCAPPPLRGWADTNQSSGGDPDPRLPGTGTVRSAARPPLQRPSRSPEGEKIVGDALDAMYAACRVLAARGLTGALEVWNVGSAFPAIYVRNVAAAARFTVREDRLRGPTLVRYRPRFASGVPPTRRRAASSLARLNPGIPR